MKNIILETDTTVRLSIGLEDKSDLLEDIKQALRIKL